MWRLTLSILVLFLAATAPPGRSQSIYLNSYASDSSDMSNCVFKIDLANRRIADSLVLPANGEFTSKAPVRLSFGSNGLLITSLVNGLAAKNSVIREHTYSYYYFINSANLHLIWQDSVVDRMIETVASGLYDTISVDWYNETDRLSMKSLYRVDPQSHRLEDVRTRRLTEDDYRNRRLAGYVGPELICRKDAFNYYWGFEDVGDSSFVNLIKVAGDTAIVSEERVGNRTIEDIVCGYSPQTEKINAMIVPFKLLYFSPVYESPDYVSPEVLIIEPQDLRVEETIQFEMGDVYAPMEVGTAHSAGPYMYYYFFGSDGYGRFDPAYLLIFDTRTNEASWLRVGWR